MHVSVSGMKQVYYLNLFCQDTIKVLSKLLSLEFFSIQSLEHVTTSLDLSAAARLVARVSKRLVILNILKD